MKIKPFFISLPIITLCIITGFSVASAQSTFTPTEEILTVTPSIPVLSTTLRPLTAEPLPLEETPVTTDTQQSSGTSAFGGTQETDGLTGSYDNLPEPELPVLDLGMTEETSETQAAGETAGLAASPICIDPQKAGELILGPVIGNQVKFSLLVFLGAFLGAILWALSNISMAAARGRREELRLERQGREETRNRRLENLQKSYAALPAPLENLIKQSGGRAVLDEKALQSYKKAAVDIELFGSVDSLAAHNRLVALLSRPELPPAEEIEFAKSDLLKQIRQDLGTSARAKEEI